MLFVLIQLFVVLVELIIDLLLVVNPLPLWLWRTLWEICLFTFIALLLDEVFLWIGDVMHPRVQIRLDDVAMVLHVTIIP